MEPFKPVPSDLVLPSLLSEGRITESMRLRQADDMKDCINLRREVGISLDVIASSRRSPCHSKFDRGLGYAKCFSDIQEELKGLGYWMDMTECDCSFDRPSDLIVGVTGQGERSYENQVWRYADADRVAGRVFLCYLRAKLFGSY